jgi:hypothetical protein
MFANENMQQISPAVRPPLLHLISKTHPNVKPCINHQNNQNTGNNLRSCALSLRCGRAFDFETILVR